MWTMIVYGYRWLIEVIYVTVRTPAILISTVLCGVNCLAGSFLWGYACPGFVGSSYSGLVIMPRPIGLRNDAV